MAIVVAEKDRTQIMNVLFWYLLKMETDVALDMHSKKLTVADVKLEVADDGSFSFKYEEYQPFEVFAAMRILAVDVQPVGQEMARLWQRGIEILRPLPRRILTDIAIKFIDACLGDTGDSWKNSLDPFDIAPAIDDALRVQTIQKHFN